MSLETAEAVATAIRHLRVAPGHELDRWQMIALYWRALPEDAVVGFAGEGRCCPLAKWLRDVLQAPHPWVDESGYVLCHPIYRAYATPEEIMGVATEWRETRRDHALPEWAVYFVRYIDQLIPPRAKTPDERAVPVRAAQAVELLDRAVAAAAAADVERAARLAEIRAVMPAIP